MARIPPINPSGIAKTGVSFLRKIIYDDDGVSDKRRDIPRETVAGEVVIYEMPDKKAAPSTPPVKHRVFIRDLSKGGCGLWSRVRFAQGTTIGIILMDTNLDQTVLRRGRVCHCQGQEGTGYALGIRFEGGAVPVAA